MGGNDLPVSELDLNVSQWGNSLAVRLPVALARQLGVRAGDTLHASADEAGNWLLSPKRRGTKLSKAELMARMRQHLATMPRTESVMEEVRGSARY